MTQTHFHTAIQAKTPVYIFDIDGTLADCSHRLHHIQKEPEDWRAFFAACHLDTPIRHMVALCQTLFDADKQIVYVSGRSDECRQETLAWMANWELPIAPLYMRRAGDHRDDDTLKIVLLAHIRADGYEPIMAFEDRTRVVKAWRAIGIPCAQVAEGDF